MTVDIHFYGLCQHLLTGNHHIRSSYDLFFNMHVIKLTAFSNDNEFTISNTEDLCPYPPSAEVCHRRCFPAAASEVHQVGIMQSQDADNSTCCHQLQSKIHLETSKQKVRLLMIQKNTAFFNFARYIYLLCVINSNLAAVD